MKKPLGFIKIKVSDVMVHYYKAAQVNMLLHFFRNHSFWIARKLQNEKFMAKKRDKYKEKEEKYEAKNLDITTLFSFI